MSQLNECVVALAGLVALWGMWYFLLKEQRIDGYREELFAIRDELFDMAANGELKFQHSAYTEFRMLLNGMLRFGHRANLVGLIIAVLRSHLREGAPDGITKWEKSLQELPKPTRSKLLKLHQRMAHVYMLHLVTGSLSLSVLAGPALLANFFAAICRRALSANWVRLSLQRGVDRALARVASRNQVQAFEIDAYFSEREARSRMDELQVVV
jgi:hypothetical protein